MDYCIACRRYLNGALACAGCGTPAEHLRSAAPAVPAAPAPAFGSDPAALADVYADSLVVLSGERGQGRGRGQGRAADRRRAGHRRRRRTALTVGLGLMLAAGATLGLARLAVDGERTDRAATVVLTDDAGPAEPAPLPGLTDEPAAPSGTASTKGPVKGTAGSAKPGGTGRSTGASTEGASGSASGAGPSRSASRTPSSAAPSTSGSSGSASPSKSANPKGPKGKPGKQSPPPPPPPSPSPTPTRDCWWIFC
ncbi:hypothetical protein OG730_28320 [Streptomyces sp. NBC_01298]|uniref:SCO2400 family protein n=1 Tax=Streptomyces sp. NBC_01298 TaxID=2903817 RepID=UPI002E0F8F0E|nr:hypothetical protein OG730_28320 [Streptomyces sp. NBC_01298]